MYKLVTKNGKKVLIKTGFFVTPEEDEDDDPDPGSAPAPKRVDPKIVASRYGSDVTTMANHILDVEHENWKLRRAKSSLKTELDRVKASVPEGSVATTQKDLDELESYRKLGTPKELEEVKTKNASFETAEAERKKTEELQNVCANVAPGVKFKVSVLKDLESKLPEGATFEVRQSVDQAGNKASVAYLKYKEGSTVMDKPLLEYVRNSDSLKHYEPALLDGTETIVGTPYPSQPAIGIAPSSGEIKPTGQFQSQYGYVLGTDKS